MKNPIGCLACLFGLLFSSSTQAQTTAFSYQGRLTEGGALANGLYDFRLFAYNADAGGSQVGTTLLFDDVPVTNGLFVLYPDFGGGVLNGQPRWIEVGVRPGAGAGTYTTLSPRQPVVATPVANVASTVLSLAAGSVGTAQLLNGSVGTPQLGDASVTAAKLANGAVGGAQLAPGAVGATHLADGAVTQAKLADGTVSAAKLANGAVGAAQLADGVITSNKLAPAVVAALGGAPSGALLASFDENSTSLASGGYVKVPSLSTSVGGWNGIPERNAQTNRYSDSDGISSLWTGTELFVYGRDNFTFRFAGSRLNPATGLWNSLPTNSEPRFMAAPSSRISLVLGGSNVFALGNVDTINDNTNSTGGFYDLTNNIWRNIPTNGFTRIYDDGAAIRAQFFWTGSELLAVGSVNMGGEFGGALFSPATNGWRLVNTNGNPQVSMDSAIVGWTGTEVFIYGASRTNLSTMSGALYHPGNATWRPATTNTGPRFTAGPTRNSTIWTGSEFIGFVASSDFAVPSRFHAYNPQLDAWRPCSTNEMPALGAPGATVSTLFWTGTEVGMVGRQGVTPSTKTVVYLYHPGADTWRSFTSDTPAIYSFITDLTRVVSPQWTGSEAVTYLPVSENTFSVFRPFRFTPPRTLFFYQKP